MHGIGVARVVAELRRLWEGGGGAEGRASPAQACSTALRRQKAGQIPVLVLDVAEQPALKDIEDGRAEAHQAALELTSQD
jgi:hypothetical protein